MRFKITLNRTGRQKMLPMDYQYYLSAWIYKVIGQADPEFSQFLHSQGYTSGNKKFKLFNYSPLNFGRPKLWKDKALFEILNDQMTMSVSFYLANAAEKFVIGLFNNQQVYIGDQFNGLELKVSQVERLPEPLYMNTVSYRAISPIVISLKDETSKYAQYLSPIHSEYADLVRNNLWSKYVSLPDISVLPDESNFHFMVQGEAKSKLVTIKPYTEEQSKVRGYLFDFSLTCPIKMHQLILSTGIGEKNSMGFGWVEVMGD